ncbi:MAG: sigma-70 family RNA polymerase sigma factor [Bacteroidota bacterium]
MSLDLQAAAEAFAHEPSPRHRRGVAEAALPLVRSMVKRVPLPDHPLASYGDLENAGMLGMLQALDAYDPSHGTAFASFAYGRIRGALVDFLRSIDTLSRGRRRKVAEVLRVSDELEQETGGEMHDGMVAERMGVTVEEVQQLRSDAQQRFSLALHEHSGSDDHASPIDTLAHPAAERAFDAIERRSLFDHVCALIEQLPQREREMVALYYFENLTLRQIAEQYDLTEARISQILSKTLRGLRARLETTQPA